MRIPASARGFGGPFWVVWSASTVSFVGDGVTSGALPLLAVRVTSDARLIAAVSAMTMLGWLLLGLVAGVVADRMDRLSLMSRMDLIRAALMGVLAASVLSGRLGIGFLLVIALLLGLAAPFFDNASSSVLPELVPPERLENANSLAQMPLMVATMLIGPPLGATLFVAARSGPFLLDAVTFAVSAMLLTWVARRRPGPAGPVSNPSAGIKVMLTEGATYLRQQPILRTLALAVGLINAVTNAVIAVFVLYVTRTLGLPEAAYGWLMATIAIGALVGAVTATRLVVVAGLRTVAIGSLLVFAASIALLGIAPYVAVVIPALAAIGLVSAVWNIATISYRQRVVPGQLLGRVTSVYRLIAFLGMPVGAILAGVLTSAVGIRTTYLICGSTLLIATIAINAPLRHLPTPHPPTLPA